MNIINTIQDFRIWRKTISGSVGFVPTMGALHKGHISLVKESNKICKYTIVSIYLNSAQFSPGEDLENYPKDLSLDLEQLSKHNIAAIFLPNDNEMYPSNFSTYINELKLSKVLEGKSRKYFFQGVNTVVAKLFNIVSPTHAFFGEKDAQQLLVIKKMVLDLAYDIKIISCPIIREQSGLAMSSRNINLSKKLQKSAALINLALKSAEKLLIMKEKNSKIIKKSMIDLLENDNNIKIDYISIADAISLNEISDKIASDILVSIAVFVGHIRLIDNFKFTFSQNE